MLPVNSTTYYTLGGLYIHGSFIIHFLEVGLILNGPSCHCYIMVELFLAKTKTPENIFLNLSSLEIYHIETSYRQGYQVKAFSHSASNKEIKFMG